MYNTKKLEDFFEELPLPRENLSNYYIRSSDFQVALVGGYPREIEPLIKEYSILKIGVRLHPMAARYAMKASDEVLELAKTDSGVREFVENLKTISGYVNRQVSRSSNISMHAFGLALDFIPYSYGKKVTYWQWAKVWYPDEWRNMPLERRWLVNQQIVEIFEKHGFIWGGKWPNYDTMHFEFRPELIEYAKARNVTGSITIFPHGVVEEEKKIDE